jgi:hypothetical protein
MYHIFLFYIFKALENSHKVYIKKNCKQKSTSLLMWLIDRVLWFLCMYLYFNL